MSGQPGAANCCQICGSSDPKWTAVRIGDVVVSWACDPHLSTVCDSLQRDHELTRLEVTLWRPKCSSCKGAGGDWNGPCWDCQGTGVEL